MELESVLRLAVAAFALGLSIGILTIRWWDARRTRGGRGGRMINCEVLAGTIVRLEPEHSPLTAMVQQMEQVKVDVKKFEVERQRPKQIGFRRREKI